MEGSKSTFSVISIRKLGFLTDERLTILCDFFGSSAHARGFSILLKMSTNKKSTIRAKPSNTEKLKKGKPVKEQIKSTPKGPITPKEPITPKNFDSDDDLASDDDLSLDLTEKSEGAHADTNSLTRAIEKIQSSFDEFRGEFRDFKKENREKLNLIQETHDKNLKRINQDITDLKVSVEFNAAEHIDLKNKFKKQEEILNSVRDELSRQKKVIGEYSSMTLQCKEKLLVLDATGRNLNLILENVPSHEGEVPEAAVRRIFLTELRLENPQNIGIKSCTRLGRVNPESNRSRPVLCRFSDSESRETVWQARFRLKGTAIFLKEDLPLDIIHRRSQLLPYLRRAKQQESRAFLSYDRLIVDGKTYTINTLATLPESLNPLDVATIKGNGIHAFFTHTSPLSNFHPCRLHLENSDFQSVEQFYQISRADFLEKPEIVSKLRLAETALECKRLSHAIDKEADEKNWLLHAPQTMFNALFAKFSQTSYLKQYLLSTGEDEIVEASRDPFWGCGIPLSRGKAVLVKANWTGQNKLGKLLMEVRQALRD